MNFKSEKGFTLPEVIISAAILAIIAVTFSSIVFTGYKNRDINRERLECVSLTTSTLDEIKSYQGTSNPDTWKDIQGLKTWLLSKGFTTADNIVYKKTTTDAHNINYELSVTFDTNTGFNGLFQLTASATSPNVTNPISMVTRYRGK